MIPGPVVRRLAVMAGLALALAGCGRQGAPELSPEQKAKQGPQAPARIVPTNTQNADTAPVRPFILDKLL